MATTSSRLKELMAARKLKQIDILNLAAPYCQKYMVKLSKSDMSQFVSGKVKPGQNKLSILGLALNVSEAWLMGLDVPMERQEVTTPGGSDLSPTEETLLSYIRRLTDDQQRFLLAQIEVLLKSQG